MNRSLSEEIRPTIAELQAYFDQTDIRNALEASGFPLLKQVSKAEPYAVATMSLEKLPKGMPPMIGSIRIAAFFPEAQTKVERHPNSRQFLWSLSGQGVTRVRRNSVWEEDIYGDAIENDILASTWHFVEANSWHQSIARGSTPWLLVAIHTAREVKDEYQDELIA
ncbi:hypothetical protein [Spongiimicrobium salis]|uniref:hypothetical protein n=1 Tax=Spongiimicrobium salis TaxID=1667022 RepID=UPI00374D2C6C